MKIKGTVWKVTLTIFFLFCSTGSILLALSEGPPAGTTGDSFFSEPSCNQSGCHVGNSINAPGGSLTITGVPAQYQPGQTYPIHVTISKSGQRRWGFELAVRAASTKAQAGTIAVTDTANTQIATLNGVQYIEHTINGTANGAAQGSWTFNWTAPSTPVGDIRFSCAGNAANGDFNNTGDFIYTTVAVSSAPVAPSQIIYFAHMAVGGGFSTVFTFLNTGNAASAGNLILTGQDGKALTVQLTDSTGAQTAASSAAVNIPSGAIQIITASPLNSGDPTSAGWARVESNGGTLAGVATFQLTTAGKLVTVAGVLSNSPTSAATIPMDDDLSANRATGYAVANVGTDPITVNIQTYNPDGTQAATLTPVTLAPGDQTASFFFQDAHGSQKFKGSAVLSEQSGKQFAVVALVQVQGLYTAIPVIPQKAF